LPALASQALGLAHDRPVYNLRAPFGFISDSRLRLIEEMLFERGIQAHESSVRFLSPINRDRRLIPKALLADAEVADRLGVTPEAARSPRAIQ
jgi:hypothetical protein